MLCQDGRVLHSELATYVETGGVQRVVLGADLGSRPAIVVRHYHSNLGGSDIGQQEEDSANSSNIAEDTSAFAAVCLTKDHLRDLILARLWSTEGEVRNKAETP